MSVFPAEGYQFLGQLRLNNDRDWFASHKKEYERSIKKPGEEFVAELGGLVGNEFGVEFGSKIYRIYRDVRFSKDKTPYHSHFQVTFMPISQPDSRSQGCDRPALHFSIDPDKVTAGCGMFGFEGPMLEHYRQTVMDEKSGSELARIVQELRSQGGRLHEADLKKVPRGFPADHPRGEFLKCKGLALWFDDSNLHATGADVSAGYVAEMFRRSKSLYEWMGLLN